MALAGLSSNASISIFISLNDVTILLLLHFKFMRVGYLQAEIAMRADGKPGMTDEEVFLKPNCYSL